MDRYIINRLLIAFLLMGQILSATARSATTFRYGGKHCDLPAIGLRFNTFRDMSTTPVPPPQPTNRIWQKRGVDQKMFGYDPIELWRNDQMVGKWKNNFITVFVAKIELPIPTGIPTISPNYDDVLESSYNNWKQNITSKSIQIDKPQWLHYYTGEKLTDKPILVNGCRNLTEQYDTLSPNQTSVLFTIQSKRDPMRQFMFFYKTVLPIDSKGMKSILSSVKSIYIYPPKARKVAHVTGSSRYIVKNRSAKYLASKARVESSIQNMKGWRMLETPNYIIASNMRSSTTVKKFQEQLEKSRMAYQTFFPLKHELDEVSVVKIFEDRSEYLSYVGEDMKWTGGLWMPSRKELMISPLVTKSKSRNKVGMLETATHEGFHQYIHYAVRQAKVSTWFNEGMATFFEGIKFSGSKSFKIGITSRVNELKKMIKNKYDNIPRLIHMSQQEYYEPNSVANNYSLGWGLMFYLWKGAYVMKRYKYTEVPTRYYDELVRTQSPKKANKFAWAKINMAKFQEDFREFWNSKKYINKAIKFDIQRELSKHRR